MSSVITVLKSLFGSPISLFVISYPKSGRTWLKFILEQYKRSHTIKFIHSVAPPHPYEALPGEIQTPESAQDNKYLLLVRDPRDVIVSSYFELTKRGHLWGFSYNGTLAEYIREDRGSYRTLLAYMERWAAFSIRNPENTHILRYEDMLAAPEVAIERVLEFFHIAVKRDVLMKAIEIASFKNMRDLESGRFQGKLLMPSRLMGSPALTPGDADDLESYKTRKGGHGNYSQYVSERDIEYMDRMMKQSDNIYSYPLEYRSLEPASDNGYFSNSPSDALGN